MLLNYSLCFLTLSSLHSLLWIMDGLLFTQTTRQVELCTVGGSEPWHIDGKDLYVGYSAVINKTCDKSYAIHGGLAVNPVFLTHGNIFKIKKMR